MCPAIGWFALIPSAAPIRRRGGTLASLSSLAWLPALILPIIPGSLPAQVPEVRYRMQVSVDDSAGVILGSESIRYRQRGADTLYRLTIRLGDNAYRPGSAGWRQHATAPPASWGRLELLAARVDGHAGVLTWDEPADSTVASIALPSPLTDGDSVLLELRWRERPPALPWRPARAGRHLTLVGWYPQIMNTTAGTTVPFPALGSFLLDMDLALDQVVGGTGIPICGDPGWEGAAASPHTIVTLQHDWYPNPHDSAASAARCEEAPAGRKRVTWYSENVTEVAYGLSPAFRYEEGEFLARPVRALYERGQERVWGAGLATRRAETAMQWVLEMGGRYPWPHVTILEGLGPSGAALPMVLATDMPSQVTVLNLQGLMLTEQVLLGGARLFTVGSSAYLTGWFLETLGRHQQYRRIEREILDWDLDRLALRDEPLGGLTSSSPCTTTFCRRTEFISYQLRRWSGSDEAMRSIYASLYTDFMLRPTIPGAFQRTARRFIQPPPDTLYFQALQGALYDDALLQAGRTRTEDGRWRTTVIIERRGAGIFPRTVQVAADSDTVALRSATLARQETVTVVTRTRPRRVVLDPAAEGHDWNMLNNQRVFGRRAGWVLLAPDRPMRSYLDGYFIRRSARDHLTLGWAPTAWYNDVGGWTFGARLREDYLGRFELNEFWLSQSTSSGVRHGRSELGALLRLRNPVWLRAPLWTEALEAAWLEGRAEVRVEAARQFRDRLEDRTNRSLGFGAQWFSITRPTYLDPGYYDDAGTLEANASGALRTAGTWPIRLEAIAAGGHAYPNQGAPVTRAAYGRFSLEGAMRRAITERLRAGMRLYAGAVVSADPVPRQRRLSFASADPYVRFDSPFLRSRGALLERPGMYYHLPGGAGVRGLDPRLSGDRAFSASLELEYAAIPRPAGSLMGSVRIAAFTDGVLGRGDLDPGRRSLAAAADAGIGVRVDHHLGRTTFQTRLDLPLWVSHPRLAQDHHPDRRVGFRWSLSFLPAF